ncbi:hypothetical protein CEUSTIGMA_g10695.t1 [Chlamydomonas eustigma]|uniref:Transmembrane protein 50A n=1 Tax=Chlamydomonas eustigma TaxID=1157962 RepID=A0A250XK17_9CHLO|nr:hypothetical protein CEUSTIGMA_g10695.t1 [Chlamydomonas eustigma]|eukprot:GAX83269.1 hypothetical protein CEUSTIGMA_g10695.t1 [Chlamydomonas eustigma]
MPSSSQCFDATFEVCKPYSSFVGGLVFGAGWWIFGDALCYRTAMLQLSLNPLWLLPGLVASIAIAIMNTVSKDDISSDTYGDEAATCRSRLILMFSYFMCMAAVCGGVAILLVEQSKVDHRDLWIGASTIIQVCLISAAGLVSWVFQTSEAEGSGGYSYMY